MPREVMLATLRPLVRYVDADQAVIDAHFTATQVLRARQRGERRGPEPEPATRAARVARVWVELDGFDGFHDEGESRTPLEGGDGGMEGGVRFDIAAPSRWWPAGLGEQPLYRLTLTVSFDDDTVAQRSVTLGLTSVRRGDDAGGTHTLMIHGTPITFDKMLTMDRIDERSLLPAGGRTLVLVRDHYGSDVLYAAADRAGLLLLQCIPIDATGQPERRLASQVDRLSPHPSLAGWVVGHLGPLAEGVGARLRELDPTREVFWVPPMDS